MNTLCFLSVDSNPAPSTSALNGHSAKFSAGAVTGVTHVTQPRREKGSSILNDLEAFLASFVAYPSEYALIAHVLWIVHTFVMDVWDSTPRIAFLSAEPASGKTRALEVTELLVPRPVQAVNVSAAYLFRKVDDPAGLPTILFDEIDTIFGPRARHNEDLRGLLNAGHRHGAVAGRCIVRGNTVETVEYPAYCAVALAGLGRLPDTILTRSVIIRMRRRAPQERVKPFRHSEAKAEGHTLRDRLEAWSPELRGLATWSPPLMPPGVEDRDADIWEALLAVADAAGGQWPDRARAAAMALVAQSKESTPSLGIRLLADLREVFRDRNAMRPADILAALHQLPEAPWAELEFGKPLSSRRLATLLGDYDIASMTVRIDGKSERGYKWEHLADAWARYLPPLEPSDGTASSSPQDAVTPVTTVTDDGSSGDGATERYLFNLMASDDPYQFEF